MTISEVLKESEEKLTNENFLVYDRQSGSRFLDEEKLKSFLKSRDIKLLEAVVEEYGDYFTTTSDLKDELSQTIKELK
jgi:hypothetical protein